MADLERVLARAHKAAGLRRWEDAAADYARGAAIAMEMRAAGPARRAWEAAGEAYRRADLPERAARALATSLNLPLDADDPPPVVACVSLAGCLSELGKGDGARMEAGRALEMAERVPRLQAPTGGAPAAAPSTLVAVALDTLVGVIFGFGRKEEARALVARLGGLDPIGGGFRGAQLARLDGDFAGAEAHLARLEAGTRGHPEAATVQAAIDGERAENAILQGDPAYALPSFERGRALHDAAGRRALAWRAECGRIRATVEAGLAVLDHGLDAVVREARERGMPLLEADARIARAMATSATDRARAASDLERAAALADAAGDRLRGGRARLEHAVRAERRPDARDRLLDEAMALLVDHAPLAARVGSARR